MYFHNILFVIVITTLVGGSLTSTAAIDLNANGRGAYLFSTEEFGTPTKRQLRTEGNDEERVIPGLDKVTAPLKATAVMVADAVRLRKWLFKENSAVTVLKKLKLNEGLDEAIASPRLKVLGNYVDMFNKKYPDKRVSLVETLSVHYGEATVAMAIVSAKQIESTWYIATRLQYFQIKGWFTSGKSADDVFKILKISDDGPHFMMSLKLDTLDEYIRFFNVKTRNEEVNIFQVIRNGFGGDGNFAIVVSKAMEIPSLEATAARYQNVLFERWYNGEVEPATVLTRVFNIGKKDLASAGVQEKVIVDQYKAYYDHELGLDQIPKFINPRRA